MSGSVRRTPWGAALIPLAACAAGLLAVFHPTILSGFARMQTDPGDTLLNNYILEHSFRWISGRLSGGFWNPPVFFPVQNVAGYSDILLGSAPLYWVCRVVGFLPDTAFQLWQLAVAGLNFVVFYWWVRRDFEMRPLAGAAGAMLFAFGAPRVAQALHSQLFPQFFTILVMHGLFLIFRDRRPGTPATAAARRGWGLAAAGFVLQVYAGFYLGWFLVLALAAACLLALAAGRTRRALVGVLFQDIRIAFLAGLVTVLALLPMAWPYARASIATGSRPIPPMLMMLPRPISWLAADSGSWVYGWTSRLPSIAALPFRQEHSLMFGAVTLAAAIVGLSLSWRRRGVALLGVTALVLVVIVTMWAPDHTLWLAIRAIVPGAKSIRSAGRIVLVVAIPISLGAGLLVDRLLDRGRTVLAALLAVGCFAEQLTTTPSFDKQQVRNVVAREAAMIPAGCQAFLLTPRLAGKTQPDWLIQTIPMWVSMTRGLPTLNGYSGNEPHGWPFHDSAILSEADEARVAKVLEAWTLQYHLDPASVCWITPDRRG